MGGASSMLEWTIGYDPIVEAVGGPLFVDDLAGLTCGPRRTLRTHYFLLAAGHAARPKVATHTCGEVSATYVDERAASALAKLPVLSCWRDGRWCCVGLSAHAVGVTCRAAAGGAGAAGLIVRRLPDRCSVKTAIIPRMA